MDYVCLTYGTFFAVLRLSYALASGAAPPFPFAVYAYTSASGHVLVYTFSSDHVSGELAYCAYIYSGHLNGHSNCSRIDNHPMVTRELIFIDLTGPAARFDLQTPATPSIAKVASAV